MDKKNTVLGIVFIAAGIGFMFWQSQQIEKERIERLREAETVEAPVEESTTPADAVIDRAGDDATSASMPEERAESAVKDLFTEVKEEIDTPKEPELPEQTLTLTNDFIEVELTTRGGAIRTVEFLQTKRGGRDDYVFNQDGYLPALSLSYQAANDSLREFALDYRIVEQSSDSVTFLLDTGEGLAIRRSYQIAPTGSDVEPYIIQHSTTFENKAATAISPRTIYYNLGTARPISREQIGFNFLNVGYFDGEDAEFIPINKLTGSKGFLGFGSNPPRDVINESARMQWTSVKNQFFASVLSSNVVANDLFIYPVEGSSVDDAQPGRAGITGSAGYDVGTIAPGASNTMRFDYYVGPKEFKRLQALGNEQDRVMQFGFLGFFSKLLLAFMYAIHAIVPSWGWSIVIMTICIKLLFWPLTAKASRSQKRMSKIQGPMAELKEKYKDNPQKMQQETLKLFREHQVNPVAGCLPMLIQMPIFLGLFYMLRTASELRHEPFLWVSDLSMPDTLFEVGGFPVNILPFIMGFTMFLQMSMMPVSPTADPMQQKIFKFLPFVFMIFLYNFSSGLVLYWTVQNILTIVQQKIINSRPDEELKPVATPDPKPKAKRSGGSPRPKSKKKKSS
ncbi:MAG: membrane protein insertase YidC [Verrucomicrobia bacterium]|jgi:YidC/Oxa1 family membrane protein insertase|nr:membrane protein insertase YidC [Verrucomicrobiota bacterium]